MKYKNSDVEVRHFIWKSKPYILILFSLILIFSSLNFTSAQTKLDIYFFRGEGCPHCEKELKILDFLKTKYSEIKVYDYEIYKNTQNSTLLKKISNELDYNVQGVPFTIIGGKKFSGFSSSATPEQIEDQINFCLKNYCPDPIAEILQEGNTNNNFEQKETVVKENKIDYKNISLILFFVFLFLCLMLYLFFRRNNYKTH